MELTAAVLTPRPAGVVGNSLRVMLGAVFVVSLVGNAVGFLPNARPLLENSEKQRGRRDRQE